MKKHILSTIAVVLLATLLLAAADWSISGVITGTRLVSTIATGTAPLTVASTTLVTNLHAATADAATTVTGLTPTSCTNQFVTAISASGSGTCTTDTLASAQHANQGTTTTLLHGNAAGNPSFAAVSLTADVSGILPVANGGTNNAFFTVSGPATSAKTYTFPNADSTITITVASGTSALATGAITSGTCATAVTTTATGTATTDTITADFNADPTAVTGYTPAVTGMLTIIKYPTANNVNFKVCNLTLASITPGAITLNWRVVR